MMARFALGDGWLLASVGTRLIPEPHGPIILQGDPGSRQEGEAGKAIAAICHAPWELVLASRVGGRTPTSYHTIRDEFVNAQGIWVKSGVTSSWR